MQGAIFSDTETRNIECGKESSREVVMADPVIDSARTETSVLADETTAQLANIWQKFLGVELIGLDQNYFDLGGDSSLAVQIFAEIETTFDVKLPLATLY